LHPVFRKVRVYSPWERLAALAEARFVSASEVEKNRRLVKAKV
jgi:putative DNA primase/helicase